MVTRIIRVAQGERSTLGHLYIDGLFASYLLEDSIREIKIPGETCIPTGVFKLGLNNSAGKNAIYLKDYPSIHKGMVEIECLPNFSLIFFHKGNTHLDTKGCLLTGHYWIKVDGDYQVMLSAFAYGRIYPKLVDQILKGNDRIVIKNKIQTS